MTDDAKEARYYQTYTDKGFELLARATAAEAELAARAAPCQIDGCQFARATAAEARVRELEAGLAQLVDVYSCAMTLADYGRARALLEDGATAPAASAVPAGPRTGQPIQSREP